jgi:hypothetical protein
MRTEEDEEFERIEREQETRERAKGWRKRQVEDEDRVVVVRMKYRVLCDQPSEDND